MYNTGSIALASSLIKARGTPGFFGDVLKQPFQQSRKYHHPCEPRHLSWQWRPKLSPDVNKCHSSTLKKKSCPEYRFFPRFKKSYIPQDITACEPPPPKPKTWSEYLSFLLPEEVTRKPKPTMCRKMLEHRRRKCMDKDDYTRCIQGECWPLPTEWYGQGVLHISELALSKEPIKAAMDAVKPCPPPAHMISRCIEKKLPVCPAHDKSCLDSVIRKMPYSQFRAAETDGSPPTVTLKCPIKYSSELLPDHRQDKSLKLSCRTYGEFKTVECPKQMFNRYMSVDLNSKNLVPVPITVPGYTPQREVKKGVCGRQSLLRPPSSRNFSTGSSLMSIDYPEFMRNIDSSHLQPGRSVICFDKLAGRAGMDTELLSKTRPERKSGVTHYNKFTEEELEKHEKEARKDEETPEQRQKRADSSKSKLQLLIEKQERERGNKGKNKVLKSAGPPEEPSTSPLFTRMVDLEETPYQRSRFHSSSNLSARKNREDRGSKSSKGSKMKIGDGQICSGCPGVQESENNQTKRKSKCSTSRGGAKGRCRVQRPLRPGEKISPLSVKCKNNENSPCMRPRSMKQGGISLWKRTARGFQTPSVNCRRSLHEVRHVEGKTCNQQFNESKSHHQEASYAEQKIYGQKVTFPSSETAQKEALRKVVSVPFRSPTSVMLGYHIKGTEVKNRFHAEYVAHTAKKEAAQVLKLFSDRYRKARGSYEDTEDKNGNGSVHHAEDTTPNQVDVASEFQDIGGFLGENSKSSHKINSDASAFAERKLISDELTEELARRQRYRMKLEQKLSKQTYPSGLYKHPQTNVCKTKSPLSVKWPATIFADVEEIGHQSPEMRERRLRRITQKGNLRFPQNNTKNNRGMLKQIANDWSASVDVSKPKFKNKPVNYALKQTTVNLGPSATEIFIKESMSMKSTMKRIKDESSLKCKVTKMFKKLEDVADSILPRLRKSRKVVICKTSPTAHNIRGNPHYSKINKPFRYGRKQERSVHSTSVSGRSDITTEKYINYPGNHQRAYQISDIFAKPEDSKKKRFRPIVLDTTEERDHGRDANTELVMANTTHSEESKPSLREDIEHENEFTDKFEVGHQKAIVDDSKTNAGVEDNVEALKPIEKSEGSEQVKSQGGFRDEFGRAWELTSYDRQIVDDCRKKMMKLTLQAEHKDDDTAERNSTDEAEHTDSTPFIIEDSVQGSQRPQEQHERDSAGDGDGGQIPQTENELGERVVFKNIITTKKKTTKKSSDYDEIWTWRD